MTVLSRPDVDIFANAAQPGEVGTYSAWLRGFGKLFDPGQTDGIPTMEQFNYIIKTLNEGIAYLAQRGVAEWSSKEAYPSGAFCQYGGKLYQAKRSNTGVVPTTSANDWSTWVLGCYSNVVPLSTTTTLTSAHVGCLVSAFSAGGFTLTLPLGSTLPAGSSIAFFGSIASGNVAVVTQAGETIVTGTSAPTGITLYPGSNFVLTWSGLAWVITGEAQLPFSPLFSVQKSGNGYQKLPSGLILQWGNASSLLGLDQTVVYPVAFPTAAISVQVTPLAGTPAPYISTISTGAGTVSFAFGTYNISGNRIGTQNYWLAIGY